MQTETIFRFILAILVAFFVAHRGYYSRKHREAAESTIKKREEGLASKLAGLLGLIGAAAMLVYIVQPGWLSWASISLPLWLRWAGLGLAATGFTLLQWAQNTLGKNWSDTPRMIKGQELVTGGPYRFIRHPIYTSFILILESMFFISTNWLIGFSWIGMVLLETASRINFEESLMLENFGDRYREYMKDTGRLLPRLSQWKFGKNQ